MDPFWAASVYAGRTLANKFALARLIYKTLIVERIVALLPDQRGDVFVF